MKFTLKGQRRPPSNESKGSSVATRKRAIIAFVQLTLQEGRKRQAWRERATVRSRIPFRRWCFQHWFKRRKGSI